MFNYNTQSVPVATRRWTPRRIRLAGLAAIVGALLLVAHIMWGTYHAIVGSVPGYMTVGTGAYYLSEGTLFVAWVGIFLGFAALRARLLGLESRLWNVGSALATIGAALAAIGFAIATIAPAVGATGVVDPANMIIGLGLMVGITLGSFLMGIALFRTGAASRLLAGLLVLVLPMTLLAGPVGEALGVGSWVMLAMIAPLVAAVIVIGHSLRTETPETIEREPLPDSAA